MPTTRDLNLNKEYPVSEIYRLRFGSFKNALIKANLYNLIKNEKLFNRHEYTMWDIAARL